MTITRRELLGAGAAAAATFACKASARRTVRARPEIPFGVASGDPSPTSAMIWSRCDRPAQLVVEWSTDERFATVQRVRGDAATPANGLTARARLADLPAGAEIFYRVLFEDGTTRSAPGPGRLRLPPATPRDLTIAWSGDVCGQGWGINPEWGGLRGFAALRRFAPDVFVHSGDQIYADNPLEPEVRTPDGRVWKNLVTPAKQKVAETLDEFRGQFTYNLLDESVRAFNASVPMVAQWDDHEVRNNWNPGLDLATDPRYRERDLAALAARARQAFLEHNAITPGPIHRRVSLGPQAELFVLDARSFRGANSPNREPGGAAMLGRAQLDWLVAGLGAARATWKIVCCDVPFGLVIFDGPANHEGFTQGDPGPALGREQELAALFAALRERRVRNVLVITADVHYAAAHRYAALDGLWELVAGPLHAGTFGPNRLDPTFGPEAVFVRAPPAGVSNLAPWDGMQSFGALRIDGRRGTLEAALHDGEGALLWRHTLEPV